ncbi:MAG: cyclic nucleotide-binding domain-containing protein [Burkholderiaceae bacterium]|nr:cyclic nucleotide-binding domain-containing protein [Burkholderiales bacterium]MBP7565230.1 cyclic nucleotide-binding domain-containing protein [Burkholderiaceae bacterium]
MKSVFGLLKRGSSSSPKPYGAEDAQDSQLFTSAFAELGVAGSILIPWELRAGEIDAKRINAGRGTKLLQQLWSKDRYMGALDEKSVMRLEKFFDFAIVPPSRDIIVQDEYGNFMVVLLTGSIAVDRLQPWGEQLRLTEAKPGDILGEMSLLDSGLRFSACTTLTECEIAVLSAEGMDAMMTEEPQLAASLVALLGRKLSLRLRVVSARLSDRQS